MRMSGKKVLITGAAGGLGGATTWAFAREGATVYALDQGASKADALRAAGKSESREASERVRFVDCDLSDLAALRGQLDELFTDVRGVDVLINNAAIYPSKAIDEYSIEEHQLVQRVNADAALVCVQASLPFMKRQRSGRIINVLSITMNGGWANLLPYVTSKGAMLGMTRAMARELGVDGITVNAVSPGAFPTDAEKIHPNPESYTQFVLDHQAIKRRGKPQDIAEAMMFFASDAAGFITGQTLNVDGGWIMH